MAPKLEVSLVYFACRCGYSRVRDVVLAAADPATVTTTAPRAGVTRITPPEKQDPAIKFKSAKENGAEWGDGPEGYKPPSKPAEKMRYVA